MNEKRVKKSDRRYFEFKKIPFQVIKRKPNLLLLKKNWFIITKVVIILKKKIIRNQ